ncbi:MAG: DNA-binding protein [Bacteroides sp.]|nr:DNA-binding protein [Bacteroides sp.]
MGMIYLVRKKLFRTKEGMKELYYAVQRTLQARGGVTTEKLAKRMASRKGMGEGDVQGVLVDLPRFIEEALCEGESVTTKGLGSFNLAISSDGFEHPDDVMPSEVRVSRIYFNPDRGLVNRLREDMRFFRYPLSKYFPADMLRPETLKREQAQSLQDGPWEDDLSENKS